MLFRSARPGTTTVITTTVPGTTTTVIVPGETTTETTGGETAGGAAAGGEAAGGGDGAGAGGDAGQAGVEVPDEEVPQGPADIQAIDDEEVPLANGSDIVGDSGVKMPSDFAKLIGIPVSAKVGIGSALVLAGGFAVRFFALRKRRRQEDE